MIDPEVITEKDIDDFKKNYGLAEFYIPQSKEYFLRNKLLCYSLDLDENYLRGLVKGRKEACFITGFGVTGQFHLGNKLVLNELKYFAFTKNEVYLFLSYADSLSKKVSEKSFLSIESKLFYYIKSQLSTKNVIVNRNYRSKKSPIYQSILGNITKNDFEKIFGKEYTEKNHDAILDMTTSILEIQSDKKKIVLLGIDEIYNALFIKFVAKKLGLSIPAFLFNKLLIGYDGKKMGKTRENYSLIVCSDANYEIKKMHKNYDKDLVTVEDCPACLINKYSEFGRLDVVHSKNCVDIADKIIVEECNLF